MLDWTGTRVCVTGGAGFLGSFVVEQLRARRRHARCSCRGLATTTSRGARTS